MSGPSGIAIDPAAGRIYWANFLDGTIRCAPIAGLRYGPGHILRGTIDTLYSSPPPPLGPGGRYPLAAGVVGLVIDPTPGGPALERLEMADTGRLAIGGSLTTALAWARDLFSSSSSSSGRIYWCSGDGTILGAPLAGGGPVDALYSSAQGALFPSALAVLRAPLATGAPTISYSLILDDQPFGGLQFGGSHFGPVGQLLSCSRGMWAADLPGAFLYRAPESFAYQWRRGGSDIGGATAAEWTPTMPGSYTCRVTASNRAGNAAQTSAAVTVL